LFNAASQNHTSDAHADNDDAAHRAKLWQEKNAEEKAEWVKAEVQRMRGLFAMLSSQVQEIGRRVKAIRENLRENE
jgi:hypothetical protein